MPTWLAVSQNQRVIRDVALENREVQGCKVPKNKKGKKWKVEGEKQQVTKKEYRRLKEYFQDGGFDGTERALDSHA